QDKVKRKLGSLIHNYEHLAQHFLSSGTRINLVMNRDRLSLSEALRIREKLGAIGIGIDKVIVNKVSRDDSTADIEREFGTQKISSLPLAPGSLVGYSTLKAYTAANAEGFQD